MADAYAVFALREAIPPGHKLTHVATVWAHVNLLDDPPMLPWIEGLAHEPLDRSGAPAAPRTDVLRVTREQARVWHREHLPFETFEWPPNTVLLTVAAYAPIGAPNVVITEENP